MTGHPTESLPQSNVPSEEGLIASSALLQNSNSGFLFLSCRPHFFNCLSIYSFVSFFSSSHLLPHFIISLVTLSPRSSHFFLSHFLNHFMHFPLPSPSPPPPHFYILLISDQLIKKWWRVFLLITQPFTLITRPSRDVSVRESMCNLCSFIFLFYYIVTNKHRISVM